MKDIPNEDVLEVLVEIPDGHRHIRTKIVLRDGSEFLFREATVSNVMRAFLTVKTDPRKRSVRLLGRKVSERKPGFAEWQLLEE